MVGPAASWLEDEAEEVVLSYLLARAIDCLRKRLERRIQRLDAASDAAIDDVLAEIKRQLAAAAVDGDVVASADLAELATDLLLTRESIRTL